MSGPIKPITTAPAAFSGIVDKLNEVIAANPPLQAGKGIRIDTAKENRIVSIVLTDDDIGLAQHPFRIVNASTTTPAAKVRVIYGTVNNFVPTIGGTSLFTAPPPTLTVVTGTVYLDATVDGAGAVTAVIISNAASTPSDTTTRKYKTIGSVTVTSNAVTAIAQSVKTSLTLYLCNGTAIWEA
jgi:hypothetical protein